MNGTQGSLMSDVAPIVNPTIGIEKECSKCGEVKKLNEYHKQKKGKYGRDSVCKECRHKRRKVRPETSGSKTCLTCGDTKVLGLFYRDKYGSQGRRSNCKLCYKPTRPCLAKVRDQNKKWDKNNPGRRKEITETWAARHPERLREIDRKKKAKLHSTSRGKLTRSMRTRIWSTLCGGKAGRHWESLVGYTVEQLKRHLEKLFKQGMTWENYGQWHVDHKIPVAAFNFAKAEDVDFKRCWALSNLQPMWAPDNLKKRDKLERPFQPSLTI